MKRITLVFLVTIFAVNTAHAEKYSLFNPVPAAKLRPISTERPSKSNSVATIDAGHVQIETSFYSLKKNDDSGVKTKTQSALETTTLRLGLTQSDEFSIAVSPFNWQKIKDSNEQTTQSDNPASDVFITFKHNHLDDDGSGLSLALIPYLKIPTNDSHEANNHYEGGLRSKYEGALGNEVGFGYMFDVGAVRKSDNSSYVTSFSNIIDFSKSVTDKTSLYVEFFSYKTLENGTSAQNTLDFGSTHQVSKNFVIDAAINFGVSKAADDLLFITGASYRF